MAKFADFANGAYQNVQNSEIVTLKLPRHINHREAIYQVNVEEYSLQGIVSQQRHSLDKLRIYRMGRFQDNSMSISDRQLQKLIGIAAVAAPGVHTLTDIAEWISGGFSELNLWANYFAFIVLPFTMIGLYAVQRPKISPLGLIGSLAYGASFIYFAHTTLFALAEQVPDYETLLEQLGILYTLHGLLMIVGGVAFGVATYRASVFPVWMSVVFLTGVVLNLVLTLAGAPDLLQTLGSALRNLGLIGMGGYLTRNLQQLPRAK